MNYDLDDVFDDFDDIYMESREPIELEAFDACFIKSCTGLAIREGAWIYINPVLNGEAFTTLAPEDLDKFHRLDIDFAVSTITIHSKELGTKHYKVKVTVEEEDADRCYTLLMQ